MNLRRSVLFILRPCFLIGKVRQSHVRFLAEREVVSPKQAFCLLAKAASGEAYVGGLR